MIKLISNEIKKNFRIYRIIFVLIFVSLLFFIHINRDYTMYKKSDDVKLYFQMFQFLINLVPIILISQIIVDEYKGPIKMLLSQGIKRYKILLSKFITAIIYIVISNIVMFLIFALILSIKLKSNFLDLDFLNIFSSILSTSLPSIFVTFLIIFISFIIPSSVITIVIGTILATSTVIIFGITRILLMLNIGIVKYLPFSYLNIETLDNNPYFNMDKNLGILVLIISILILAISTSFIFIKKDIKTGV